jgi:lipopolysaccharide export system protein LptA
MINRKKQRESGRTYTALIALSLFAASSFYAQAADVNGKTGKESKKSSAPNFSIDKKDPIFISSDHMEVDRKRNTIVYKGRVVTVQGEMTLNSDALTAYYEPEMKQIKEVIAEGKVNVTQGDRIATGAKAVFNQKEQTLVLTGNPVVRQGNSQISGTRITFYIEQDRAVAEGGNQRVKATIFPGEFGGKEKNETGSEQRR